MKTPTIEEFKVWAKVHSEQAMHVCLAQAFAQCERERVDTYILPIFKAYQFNAATHWGGKPIYTPDNLYLSEQEDLIAEFYERCDRAHREHGFTGPHGNCPALTADNMRIQAENILLKEGCSLFGLDDILSMLNHRKRMLELLIGACLIKENKAA